MRRCKISRTGFWTVKKQGEKYDLSLRRWDWITGLVIWVATGWLAPAVTAAEVSALAILGPTEHTYGVATLEIPLDVPILGQAAPPVTVSSDAGRVLFPVGEDVSARITRPSEQPVPEPGSGRLLGRLGQLLREITDKDAPTEQVVARRVSFLFTGSQPLKVRVADEVGELGVYELTPVADPQAFSQRMTDWWTAYTKTAKQQIDGGDYPPWVQTYLIAMLSGRTGNGLPQWFTQTKEPQDLLWETLQYLAGAEQVTREIFRHTAAGLTDQNQPRSVQPDVAALRPLPAGPVWKQPKLPTIDPAVETESIAARVPPECFYFRFGSFQNYLWFLDLTNEYDGDISRMINLRGTADGATERFQSQIAVKISDLSRMFGESVVKDQAVIGEDLFTADGASMGVVIESNNAFLLRSSMGSDRNKRAQSDPSLTIQNVDIDGHQVSFLSRPDNSVRSYFAEDNGFFLITNSETLVKRFFEVGKSGKSLAATDSFRLSRMLVPTSRGDTIFVYFSPQMLQGLVSPKYLIELRRRLSSDSDISLVHLARLAAASEGIRGEGDRPIGIDELIEKGFLPVSFGNRSDGSGVVWVGEQVIDTLRGARGTFLPIADIDIQQVTPHEAEWYSRIASEYSNRFPQIDPIIVALRRDDSAIDATLERVSIHAEIAPLTPEKYGKWAEQLGPPTGVVMRFAPDDIVSLQAHVASDQLGPPTHLFAAIKDTFPPEPKDFDGLFKAYRSLRQLPSYLGAWPQPGALDRLPLGIGRGRPVGPGMYKLLGGLYRYSGGGFSVLSFQKEILESSLAFLEAVEVEQEATARGRIGSLLGSQLEGWVNNQLYQRAARSSLAGAEFLNLLTQQLHVPPQQSFETARTVLNAPLQCSLGGQYQYNAQSKRWQSTAWNGSVPPAEPPADYTSPLLIWFRGGHFTLTQYADRLVADAVITVARHNRPNP
ncbi:hypothetical protein NHH03_23680 [Stieleria sp. TO1_6]|uniref:hypothetical protein n=1 Tax=Stieleria tagensis TaxID=2956795 RepID=UPI00209AD41C|nr:hypothetical protein [Stieleria tagensis]MCO8124758.1 hypothetical protein [Stieleria tagensis]